MRHKNREGPSSSQRSTPFGEPNLQTIWRNGATSRPALTLVPSQNSDTHAQRIDALNSNMRSIGSRAASRSDSSMSNSGRLSRNAR